MKSANSARPSARSRGLVQGSTHKRTQLFERQVVKMAWTDTGQAPPKSLTATRIQAHYGALILGSAAHAVLEPKADSSHTNLGFENGKLKTWPVRKDAGSELQLHLSTLELSVPESSTPRSRWPLAGQTLDRAFDWVGTKLARDAREGTPFALREYPDAPESTIRSGAPFDDAVALELSELSLWFENASGLMESLRSSFPNLTSPRIWPHHFDLGVLIALDGSSEKTIGLGMSPGDQNYDQPYFYCSPYPSPGLDAAVPELSVGSWHRSGFLSAVLTATELQSQDSQEQAAHEYLESAIAACRSIIR